MKMVLLLGEEIFIISKHKNGTITIIGAVVTKEVPEDALVMGAPAKIIRYLDESEDN